MSVSRWLISGFIVSVFGLTAFAQPPASHRSLRIGLLTRSGTDPDYSAASVNRGVRLGAAETRQTANLFGDDVELYEADAGKDVAAAASRLISERGVQVLMGSTSQDADPLSRFAETHHVVFLNVASRAQSLRATCRRFTFHVEATDAMYSNAARAFGRSSRQTTRALPEPSDSVVIWGPSLERYGASQINDRYRGKYGVGMDGSAWAGWVAVKIVAEAALRARSSEPSKLLAYLESSDTQFDGHKGWPLTFRIADHQLRQPLYVVLPAAPGKPRSQSLRDVPELRSVSSGAQRAGSRSGDRSANEVLDRLISSPTAPRCSGSNR